MFDEDFETFVRLKAFEFLEELNSEYGDILPRDELKRGFHLRGQHIHVIGPQGIFKPKVLKFPISITTSPDSPYDDAFTQDFLNYKYRGNNPNHFENVGLRETMRQGIPLIYFHGILPGQYIAHWPVFVIADSPDQLTFGIAFDERTNKWFEESQSEPEILYRRRYTTATVKRRLHQQTFRERVLQAYKHSCALCKLRHPNLLEAAHIIPDNEDQGAPIVSNGLSFCKLHHAAFDSYILGIRPDFTAEIREDVLHEIDGPMLQHGLKEMHGKRIFVPQKKADKPNVDFLEIRYGRFRDAPVNS